MLHSSPMELVKGKRAQRECWASKSFHLHQTADSAGSTDWANSGSTAASWRSLPPDIWCLYRSFTVQHFRPFSYSNTQQPMCGYTHNAHAELKQSNYISTAKHIILLFNTNKWLVQTVIGHLQHWVPGTRRGRSCSSWYEYWSQTNGKLTWMKEINWKLIGMLWNCMQEVEKMWSWISSCYV